MIVIRLIRWALRIYSPSLGRTITLREAITGKVDPKIGARDS